MQHSVTATSLVRCVVWRSTLHAPAHAPGVCTNMGTGFMKARGSAATTSQVPLPTVLSLQLLKILAHDPSDELRNVSNARRMQATRDISTVVHGSPRRVRHERH